jgi:hypothetical protein
VLTVRLQKRPALLLQSEEKRPPQIRRNWHHRSDRQEIITGNHLSAQQSMIDGNCGSLFWTAQLLGQKIRQW